MNKMRSLISALVLLAGSATAFANPINASVITVTGSDASVRNTDPVRQFFAIKTGAPAFGISGFDATSGTYYATGTGIDRATLTRSVPRNQGDDYANQVTINSLPRVASEPASLILFGTGLLCIYGKAVLRKRSTSGAGAA